MQEGTGAPSGAKLGRAASLSGTSALEELVIDRIFNRNVDTARLWCDDVGRAALPFRPHHSGLLRCRGSPSVIDGEAVHEHTCVGTTVEGAVAMLVASWALAFTLGFSVCLFWSRLRKPPQRSIGTTVSESARSGSAAKVPGHDLDHVQGTGLQEGSPASETLTSRSIATVAAAAAESTATDAQRAAENAQAAAGAALDVAGAAGMTDGDVQRALDDPSAWPRLAQRIAQLHLEERNELMFQAKSRLTPAELSGEKGQWVCMQYELVHSELRRRAEQRAANAHADIAHAEARKAEAQESHVDFKRRGMQQMESQRVREGLVEAIMAGMVVLALTMAVASGGYRALTRPAESLSQCWSDAAFLVGEGPEGFVATVLLAVRGAAGTVRSLACQAALVRDTVGAAVPTVVMGFVAVWFVLKHSQSGRLNAALMILLFTGGGFGGDMFVGVVGGEKRYWWAAWTVWMVSSGLSLTRMGEDVLLSRTEPEHEAGASRRGALGHDKEYVRVLFAKVWLGVVAPVLCGMAPFRLGSVFRYLP
ncbi:unnamed protein product [Pedinophyceae sp. YPF-701]|nr:unnamed protein product [Pedinophyceae sp. YPF-701]